MELDAIGKQIKGINRKIIPISVLAGALGGAIAYPFGPSSPLFLTGWVVMFFVGCFAFIYNVSFRLFGENLEEEAKERGQHIVNNCEKYVPERDIAYELANNPSYDNYSDNIYHINENDYWHRN